MPDPIVILVAMFAMFALGVLARRVGSPRPACCHTSRPGLATISHFAN
jgi:hypothetical protein